MNKEKATIYDYARMCKTYHTNCPDCPMWDEVCTFCIMDNTQVDKANEIILNWCKEHPVKTRQNKFWEHYSHARATKIGVLDICPKGIDIRVQCMSEDGLSCSDCKKSYWLAEVEE